MELKVKQYSYTDIYVIDVVGEMDLYNSFKLKELVEKMIEEKKNKIIINLESLEYIDSGGIGTLININSIMKKNNQKFQIVNVKGLVRRVIELTKLMNYFPISESIDDAVDKL
jgi:anti-sigma B factor antagonist